MWCITHLVIVPRAVEISDGLLHIKEMVTIGLEMLCTSLVKLAMGR